MSDLSPTLLQETHKPELMAGTSTLSYGGGMTGFASETGLSLSGSGRAVETASFPGGITPDAGSQLDALQARALSTSDLVTRLAASTSSPGSSPSLPRSDITGLASLDISAGHAVAALVASGGNASPAIQDAQGGLLPGLQFLSDETAIRTVASVATAQDTPDKLAPSFTPEPAPAEVTAPASGTGTETDTHNLARPMPVLTDAPLASGPEGDRAGETVSGTVASASPSSAPSADVSPHPAMLRSFYIDNPAYAYAVSNTNGGMDNLSFNDNYNQIYPGLQINTAYDDIGERRDAAWKLPSMHAYPSPDSGYRADQVQLYWKNNADAIGMAIIGTPIPHDRWVNLRDMLHGDIKNHHRGNQETMSKIAHLLATQDNQTTAQLNAIWHNVLGTAIDSASLTNAISQISVGHATLQTERQALAHSSAAASLYARKYQDIHGHPASEADIRFAQDKIGNGTSLQQYIWDEAHSEQTAAQLRDFIPAVQDRSYQDSDAGWVRWKQDQLGDGQVSMQQTRKDLATWSAQNGLYDRHFEQVHGIKIRPEDRIYAGNMIGNGWSVQDYRHNEVYSEWARSLYGAMFRNLTGYDANADEIRAVQDKIGRGASYEDARHDLAYSDYGRASVQRVYAHTAGIQNPAQFQFDAYQARLAQGANVSNITYEIAHSWEGHDAVRKMLQRLDIQNPTQFQFDHFQGRLGEGADPEDIYRQAAQGWEGDHAVEVALRRLDIQTPTQDQRNYFKGLLNQGKSMEDVYRQAATGWEGDHAVEIALRRLDIQNPTQDQRNYFKGLLNQGKSMEDVYRQAATGWEGDHAVEIALRRLDIQTPTQDQRNYFKGLLNQGKSMEDVYRQAATGWEGDHAVEIALRRLDIQNPTQDQRNYFKGLLNQGKSMEDVYRQAATGWEGDHAVEIALRRLDIQNPTQDQRNYFKGLLNQGKSMEDVYRQAATGWEGRDAVDTLARKVFARDLTTNERSQYQNQLASGQRLSDLQHDMVVSEEGRFAINKIIETELGIKTPSNYLEAFISNSLLSSDKSLSNILSDISFDPPKDPTFSVPTVTPNNDPINKTFLPEGAVFKLLSGSHTASTQLTSFYKKGWSIVFGETNSHGSAETRFNEKKIVVDPARKDNIYMLGGIIAHELGHFYIKNKYNYASKEKFINSSVRGEGAATINNYIIQAELGNTIWAGGGYDTKADADLKAAYEKGVKDNNLEKAYDEAGEIYRTKVKFPDGKTYGEHYAEYFDSVNK